MSLRDRLKEALEGPGSDVVIARRVQEILAEEQPTALFVTLTVHKIDKEETLKALRAELQEKPRMYLRKLVDKIGLDCEIAISQVRLVEPSGDGS